MGFIFLKPLPIRPQKYLKTLQGKTEDHQNFRQTIFNKIKVIFSYRLSPLHN